MTRVGTIPLSEHTEAANEWDYDVRERVANAVDCIETRDGDLATLLHLRWQLRELMEHTNPAHLSAPELIAMIAILAPANGRRLVTESIEESLRPILRIVATDGGDAPTQLGERGADEPDEFTGGQILEAIPS